MRDKTRLIKALNEVKASDWQVSAASILYSVNGIDNALEYVCGLRNRNLARDGLLTQQSLPGFQVIK